VLLFQPQFPVQRSLLYFSKILIAPLGCTMFGLCVHFWAPATSTRAAMGRVLNNSSPGAGARILATVPLVATNGAAAAEAKTPARRTEAA
jgi:hypothetical protein